MGLSKRAFDKTGGFSALRFGEDIDLTFRLWGNNFETQFIEKAYVYHKRRVSWSSFFKQTFNFGAARPILNKLHPSTAKITYWFPSVFIIGLVLSIIGIITSLDWLSIFFLFIYLLYFVAILMHSLIKNKNSIVSFLSVWASLVMFFGYGSGFLRSKFRLLIGKSPKEAFPEMFR